MGRRTSSCSIMKTLAAMSQVALPNAAMHGFDLCM
jgi:hypothetical protein